jgi:putative chitinase
MANEDKQNGIMSYGFGKPMAVEEEKAFSWYKDKVGMQQDTPPYRKNPESLYKPSAWESMPDIKQVIEMYSSQLLNTNMDIAALRPTVSSTSPSSGISDKMKASVMYGGDLTAADMKTERGAASVKQADITTALTAANAKPTAIQDAEEYSGLMSRVVPQQGPDVAPLQGPGIAPIKTVAMLKDTNTMNMSATETSDFKQNIKQTLIDKLGNSKKTAAILGAFAKESGDDYDKLEENMYYSIKNANDANFSDTKVTRALNTLPEAVKARLLADQVAGKSTGGTATSADRLAFGGALFDTAYTGGREYRGRGLIHLTHRDNYKRIGDILGIDLENNPEWASDPQYALPIAIAYLEDKGFFKLKDNEITRDKLQAIVNPNSSTEIKNDRWAKVESYMEEMKTTGWDESLQ